ncbi:MAG TPA: phenylacetic acid degradation operon negative regulatory protein PaaX [Steroidobacteraceae bacterium]|jgi:phenylacetic acid degradation operon negative regulatory protein|nr:phenylacetic acid degradation operon negative regulatory protein PaaX [Steroidobacteraceae bacterium]
MPKTASAAAELVARFRRQRPLRGGSLIITLFGDAIMPRGGAIALGSLIELAAPFGLNERLVRTASARLAQDGWLEAHRAGKLSEYHLSKSGRARFEEATQRIYSAPETRWSGRWTLLVVPPMPASERNDIREELGWRGFGEISANVFAHPEFDSRAWRAQLTSGGPLAKVMVFDAALAADDAPHRLVELGWDLEDLGRRYQRFADRFGGVRAELKRRRDIDPGECFLARTLLIHEYRRLHLRDPLLPPPLLRDNWPGAQAADLCRDVYARVFDASERHLSRVAARLSGPLPPADASILQRFGGLGPLLQHGDHHA